MRNRLRDLDAVLATDRLLDELSHGRVPEEAGEDHLVRALVSWVGDVAHPPPDVPAAPAQEPAADAAYPAADAAYPDLPPRRTVAHRVGGGATLLALTFAGSSVAAALTGADVPVLSSFGSSLVRVVPGGEQVLGRDG